MTDVYEQPMDRLHYWMWKFGVLEWDTVETVPCLIGGESGGKKSAITMNQENQKILNGGIRCGTSINPVKCPEDSRSPNIDTYNLKRVPTLDFKSKFTLSSFKIEWEKDLCSLH